jgi:hypothetical protein
MVPLSTVVESSRADRLEEGCNSKIKIKITQMNQTLYIPKLGEYLDVYISKYKILTKEEFERRQAKKNRAIAFQGHSKYKIY